MNDNKIKQKEKILIIINYILILVDYLLFIIIDFSSLGNGKFMLNATIDICFIYAILFIVWDIVIIFLLLYNFKRLQISIKIYIIIIVSTIALQILSSFFGIELFNYLEKIT